MALKSFTVRLRLEGSEGGSGDKNKKVERRCEEKSH
jgi:hypothetical protein